MTTPTPNNGTAPEQTPGKRHYTRPQEDQIIRWIRQNRPWVAASTLKESAEECSKAVKFEVTRHIFSAICKDFGYKYANARPFAPRSGTSQKDAHAKCSVLARILLAQPLVELSDRDRAMLQTIANKRAFEDSTTQSNDAVDE